VLAERESAPLLAAYGLPLVPSRFAATATEAVAAAAALGYPVVLKVDAPGLAHKTRLGGVRVGLPDAAAVAAAFAEIVAAAGRAALVHALVRLSWFAADLADLVAECDLNPVRLYPDGLLALDALIVLAAD